MPMLIAGVLLLWLSSTLLRGFVKANPAALARLMRKGGSALALGMAALFILRGEFNLALLAAGGGLWLMSAKSVRPLGSFETRGSWRQSRHSSARRARFRSPSLDMEIVPETGAMWGVFTAGPFAGWPIDRLSDGQALESYRWCRTADPAGAELLEAYLDRRFPAWREAADIGENPGGSQTGRGARRAPGMPDHEAYHILGLAEGADREAIAAAHRRLMKQHHPDHGGSTAMAARVNEAKDVLMRRHP